MTNTAGKSFGALLRRQRSASALTQEELAERAELSVRELAYLERGKHSPRAGTVRRLADALRLPDPDRAALLAAMAVPVTNLGDEPTLFIGREREIAAISDLLQQPGGRLVTLTGPGGVGKTRLALRVAAQLLTAFPDGVFFVSLAALTDPALMLPTLAETLGIREEAGRSLLDTLSMQLRDRQLLLLLDNLEHLPAVATVCASLLDTCRALHILATSRGPLHLVREQEYPVAPLTVPDARHATDLAALAEYEAVALFLARARALQPDFALTVEHAAAIATICARLDGLPLAIELAAARLRLFSPTALLQRLSRRLTLLTGGARDLPARQQTLRGAIDWSFMLLTPEQQRLFARLSVFVDGCTLEAAEAVDSTEGALDLLDGLTTLVDQSLLRQVGEQEPRFTLLETIREYAEEQLAEHGDAERTRDRHAAYFLQLAERARPALLGPEQGTWLERLEREHDNLRAALNWLGDHGRAEPFLRLAVALTRFWSSRGYWSEALRWLTRGLDLDAAVLPAIRALALRAAAAFATNQGNHEQAMRWNQKALVLLRELGDQEQLAKVLRGLGITSWQQGNPERAIQLFTESLGISRPAGTQCLGAEALGSLAIIAVEQGDYEQAQAHLEAELALHQAAGDIARIASTLGNLGVLAELQGKLAEAGVRFAEGLALARKLGLKSAIAIALNNLGDLAAQRGDYAQAMVQYREAMQLSRELGDKRVVLDLLGDMAQLAAAQSQAARAARLLGAEAAARDALGIPLWSVSCAYRGQAAELARTALGEAAWACYWEKGHAMSLGAAMAYALQETKCNC